jgi:hypothetical protein
MAEETSPFGTWREEAYGGILDLKLKDRNTRRLAWDPDEYTVGWIERLKIKKEEREREEGEEKRLQEKQT